MNRGTCFRPMAADILTDRLHCICVNVPSLGIVWREIPNSVVRPRLSILATQFAFFFGGATFSGTCFFLALAFSHLLFAALRASSFRSSGVRALMRAFPPFGPPFFPPRFPISRMMRETTSSFTSIVYRDLCIEGFVSHLRARSTSSKRSYARSASSIEIERI
jgi:hypothetical protein